MSVSLLHVSAVFCRDLKLLPLEGILRFLTRAVIYVPVPIAQMVERPLREREVVCLNPGRAIPKALQMVPVATLLGAQHYMASTGSPLTH